MFFNKAVLLALVPAVAFVNAAPAPGILDELTSAVGSVVHAASSVVGSVVAQETASAILSDASKVFGTSTSQAYATLVTANGVPVVEVTSVGGPVITLATASGFTTSFAGHVFTAAPTSTAPASSSSSSSSSSTSSSASASATGHKNAAAGMYGPSTSGALGVAAFVGSVVAGAAMVL